MARDVAPGVDAERRAAEAAVVGGMEGTTAEDGVATQTYDRVVRIVAWTFLLAATVIVAATGLWPATQPAIFVLFALSGLFIVVVHDLLPGDALGPAKFVLEGSVAITVATLLVALTGGAASPFFFAFPLIVAGAALVVSPTITVALTAAAGLGYVLAVIAGSTEGSLGPTTVAIVGINLTALVLLAYVALVIARAQRRARDAAIRLSTVDSLTGLFNRTFFFAAIDREIARSARSGRGFCLLMMDLDELKSINDRLGHFQGDRVLRGVGEVITQGVRQIDTAARYGGDEFVALLPETDPTGRVRPGREDPHRRQQPRAWTCPGPDRGRRCRSGSSATRTTAGRADELIISADGAMYASKRAGKDRVTGVPMPRARGATPSCGPV